MHSLKCLILLFFVTRIRLQILIIFVTEVEVLSASVTFFDFLSKIYVFV